MLLATLIGALLGFIGSVPLAGPIAVLVFSRGLHQRFRSGLGIAVGAAVAEAGYAFVACWGVGGFLTRHPAIDPWLRAIAAAVLLGLGVLLIRYARRPHGAAEPRGSGRGSFVLGFMLTALNPTFLATWAAAIAVLHASGWMPDGRAEALPFAVGVMAGIIGWFALMLELLKRHGHRLEPRWVALVQRGVGVGVALVLMGIWFAAQVGLHTT